MTKSVGLNRSLSEYGIRTQKKVKLKEEEHCFKVVNTEDFDELNSHKPLTLSTGKKMSESRSEFEESVKEEYGTENVEWIN